MQNLHGFQGFPVEQKPCPAKHAALKLAKEIATRRVIIGAPSLIGHLDLDGIGEHFLVALPRSTKKWHFGIILPKNLLRPCLGRARRVSECLAWPLKVIPDYIEDRHDDGSGTN